MGAPPTTDGVIEDVKSQLSITLKDAIQSNAFSDRYLIFAAEKPNRIKETTIAIKIPGSRFALRCVNTPGVYVSQMTNAIVATLNPIEIKRYFLEKYLFGSSCICSSFFDKKSRSTVIK